MSADPAKKRHHYIPVTYLDSFADDGGMVTVYRKDEPARPFRQRPESVAYHVGYYAQPTPDGGVDTNTLEDFFSTVERTWRPFVSALEHQSQLSPAQAAHFVEFMALMRVRVPAARDAAELLSAAYAKLHLRLLHEAGELPPLPASLTLDGIGVSIDPHQSIHAMAHMSMGFGKLVSTLVFDVLHNRTDTPFVTSDNPVVYLDPTVSEGLSRPYDVQIGGPVELYFPITPSIVVRGLCAQLEGRRAGSCGAWNLHSRDHVKRINRLVARFAYRHVYADSDHCRPLVTKHADVCPVLRTQEQNVEGGVLLLAQSVFGPRRNKLRWKG